MNRVDYYCKLQKSAILPSDSKPLSDLSLKNRNYASVYFFDSHQSSRYFNQDLKWRYKFGDVRDLFDYPTIVKSRLLCPENVNSVILKLNKVRHFNFFKDVTPYSKKDNKVIFRGYVNEKPHRISFLQKFATNPMCDVGAVDKHQNVVDLGLNREKLTIKKQLESKFLMAIEGNDVATNLKWIMNSNSIAVMSRPTCETWYMEGCLKADEHYIELSDDYSDLEEKITYYIEHPREAEEIVKNAHIYVDQFKNNAQERLIELMVLKRYFEMTGQ